MIKSILSLSILTQVFVSLSYANENLAQCAGGYCDGDPIFMLSPPQPGSIRTVNPRNGSLSVQVFDSRSRRDRVVVMSLRDADYNIRSRRGCTPGRTDQYFCVGEQVWVNGSRSYGVVEGVGTYFDDVVVRRDYDRYPEQYWSGPTRGNIVKVNNRNRRVPRAGFEQEIPTFDVNGVKHRLLGGIQTGPADAKFFFTGNGFCNLTTGKSSSSSKMERAEVTGSSGPYVVLDYSGKVLGTHADTVENAKTFLVITEIICTD